MIDHYINLPSDVIVTYTGKLIKPLDPDPEQINILDIAHSLSQQCRFTGHTREFYSVAQHSVLVSDMCQPDPDNALAGLLHDATEAYISDIARPVKRTEWGQSYKEIEQRLMEAIAERFGFLLPLPDIVHEADNYMLEAEIAMLMPLGMMRGDLQIDSYTRWQVNRPWDPIAAESEFMAAYHDLMGAL